MSILPYSFCRDDTEKKTLRHGFLLGMMTAVVLLVPFLFAGGIILVNVARGSAYAEESPPVSEDVMIPYSVEPQPENNEMIPFPDEYPPMLEHIAPEDWQEELKYFPRDEEPEWARRLMDR